MSLLLAIIHLLLYPCCLAFPVCCHHLHLPDVWQTDILVTTFLLRVTAPALVSADSPTSHLMMALLYLHPRNQRYTMKKSTVPDLGCNSIENLIQLKYMK